MGKFSSCARVGSVLTTVLILAYGSSGGDGIVSIGV